MTKKQARKLKKYILQTRKRLNQWEGRCWKAQKLIQKRYGESTAYHAHDDIGYFISQLRDNLESAADNIQWEISGLLK